MKKLILLLLVGFVCISKPFFSSLLDTQYIKEVLTAHASWADSHAAENDYLGVGLLYYTLVYIAKAKTCVCLGSGGGFVPRLIRQAQRDLNISNAETILVDGNMGNYGRPDWLCDDSFFKQQFPDIQIITDTTYNALTTIKLKNRIDYLHVDADHSLAGVLEDFENYLPFMSEHGIITFHDTAGNLPCAEIVNILRCRGHQITNFRLFGAGTALLYLDD